MNRIEFCYVPPGPFLMGSLNNDEMAFDNEKPQHQLELPYGYWLARYPVTITQFTTFVQQTGYTLRDGKALLGLAACPVVYITWRDAIAFCGWLNEQWQQQGILPPDWQVTLPSEAEWEKGARGGLQAPVTPLIKSISEIEDWQPEVTLQANDNPTRRYPWGDEPDPSRANYDKSRIDHTTPVGQFPAGASLYGCEEMSGTVWEWTRSHYKAYPYDPKDGRENLDADRETRRVLRGGGFSDFERSVRCTIRFYLSRGRVNCSGFRLVVIPSSILGA